MMTCECRSLGVGGNTSERGTSLLDDQQGRVLWYDGVENGFVQLDAVNGVVELSERAFSVHLLVGDLKVEAQPDPNDYITRCIRAPRVWQL